MTIWVREGFQKNKKLDFFIRRANLRANHESHSFFLYWHHFLCLRKFGKLRKQFFNQKIFSKYKQKSNSNTRIDNFDAKSSRVPKSSHSTLIVTHIRIVTAFWSHENVTIWRHGFFLARSKIRNSLIFIPI